MIAYFFISLVSGRIWREREGRIVSRFPLVRLLRQDKTRQENTTQHNKTQYIKGREGKEREGN
jgi:thiosulfate reductase cytochrome b subunit